MITLTRCQYKGTQLVPNTITLNLSGFQFPGIKYGSLANQQSLCRRPVLGQPTVESTVSGMRAEGLYVFRRCSVPNIVSTSAVKVGN